MREGVCVAGGAGGPGVPNSENGKTERQVRGKKKCQSRMGNQSAECGKWETAGPRKVRKRFLAISKKRLHFEPRHLQSPSHTWCARATPLSVAPVYSPPAPWPRDVVPTRVFGRLSRVTKGGRCRDAPDEREGEKKTKRASLFVNRRDLLRARLVFPNHHIPPTDCPYTTDIYFISFRAGVRAATLGRKAAPRRR